jgi:hypothetical protein
MRRLSQILLAWDVPSRRGYNTIVLAELYREQGRFDQAEAVILTLDKDEAGVTSNLITKLIREKQSAPMRYRM